MSISIVDSMGVWQIEIKYMWIKVFVEIQKARNREGGKGVTKGFIVVAFIPMFLLK